LRVDCCGLVVCCHTRSTEIAKDIWLHTKLS
jgi:hypothetical protein